MPELPEVEKIVRQLRRQVKGRRVSAFESRWARQVSPSVAAVRRAMRGATIERVGRRGKYVVMQLGAPPGGRLLVHLRMSGRFEWGGKRGGKQPPATRIEPGHVRAVWRFEDGGRLFFCDARKFGRIELVKDLAALELKLGVEPLGREFTPARLGEILGVASAKDAAGSADRRAGPRSRRRPGRALKPLLLDQTRIAGLGNIYTDEALFRAGLHPLTASNRLRGEQVVRLHAAIREALAEGIRRNGASIDWAYPGGSMQDHFLVYGRTGEPCRRCGEGIVYMKVAQRGTHICPRCQALGR
jgi:formamidopyrimidine-DNA glycosylase